MCPAGEDPCHVAGGLGAAALVIMNLNLCLWDLLYIYRESFKVENIPVLHNT